MTEYIFKEDVTIICPFCKTTIKHCGVDLKGEFVNCGSNEANVIAYVNCPVCKNEIILSQKRIEVV